MHLLCPFGTMPRLSYRKANAIKKITRSVNAVLQHQSCNALTSTCIQGIEISKYYYIGAIDYRLANTPLPTLITPRCNPNLTASHHSQRLRSNSCSLILLQACTHSHYQYPLLCPYHKPLQPQPHLSPRPPPTTPTGNIGAISRERERPSETERERETGEGEPINPPFPCSLVQNGLHVRESGRRESGGEEVKGRRVERSASATDRNQWTVVLSSSRSGEKTVTDADSEFGKKGAPSISSCVLGSFLFCAASTGEYYCRTSTPS